MHQGELPAGRVPLGVRQRTDGEPIDHRKVSGGAARAAPPFAKLSPILLAGCPHW